MTSIFFEASQRLGCLCGEQTEHDTEACVCGYVDDPLMHVVSAHMDDNPYAEPLNAQQRAMLLGQLPAADRVAVENETDSVLAQVVYRNWFASFDSSEDIEHHTSQGDA